MDNDCNIKKNLVKIYRSTRLKMDYINMNFVSDLTGNSLIIDNLSRTAPFMFGRLGAIEMRCVSRWMKKEVCTDMEKDQALYAAGIFPNDNKTIEKFCEVYTEAMGHCDYLGVWGVTGEKKAITKYCTHAILMPSRAVEPYYYNNPWSAALEEKKVLIIHPFIESIQNQLTHKEQIWPGRNILPNFSSAEFIRTVQSNAGGITKFEDWFEALEYMKSQICKYDFDVAIIGAGAYGLPLAAYVKALGRQAIQMAGATQILFGIKGKRWDEHPLISSFYNDAWTRPLKSETPPMIKKVEGGSYW